MAPGKRPRERTDYNNSKLEKISKENNYYEYKVWAVEHIDSKGPDYFFKVYVSEDADIPKGFEIKEKIFTSKKIIDLAENILDIYLKHPYFGEEGIRLIYSEGMDRSGIEGYVHSKKYGCSIKRPLNEDEMKSLLANISSSLKR